MTKDYIEVKKENINFKGDTESEKKANEVIYDLTLEIDRLQHRIAELSKINEEHRKLNGELRQWDKNKDTRNSRQRVANAKLMKENKELKNKLDMAEINYNIIYDYFTQINKLLGTELCEDTLNKIINLQKENEELKYDIKGYKQERQVLLDGLNEITKANKKIKRKYSQLEKKLEEKDKVIDEIKNALTNYKSEWAEDDQVVKDINTFLKILDKEVK